MGKERILDLYTKIKGKTATAEQEQEFDVLLQQHQHEETLKSHWDQQWENILVQDKSSVEIKNEREILNNILSHKSKHKSTHRLWVRMAMAAAIICAVFGAGLFYYQTNIVGGDVLGSSRYTGDVDPGKMGATLTLSNGKRIKLEERVNGEIAKEAGIIVSKTADGQIVYEISSETQAQFSNLTDYNTLTTARGETYQLRLPDGSRVWLNAASSLTYSTSLKNGGKRIVKLDGEAYFEIAKVTHSSLSVPFIVLTKKQEVTVLGTHFNVNSYGDEPATTTTLLEGSVKIAARTRNDGRNLLEKVANEEAILKPNQQSILNQSLRVIQIDAAAEVAWKDGKFVFTGEPIEVIMRKISRWYNVEIVYEGPLPMDEFAGSLSRFSQVSQALKKLELTNRVHFKIEGRKIIVKQ